MLPERARIDRIGRDVDREMERSWSTTHVVDPPSLDREMSSLVEDVDVAGELPGLVAIANLRPAECLPMYLHNAVTFVGELIGVSTVLAAGKRTMDMADRSSLARIDEHTERIRHSPAPVAFNGVAIGTIPIAVSRDRPSNH